MEKRKREEEAKKKREKKKESEDNIWGSEEDFAEEPGNDRQTKEDDAEKAFLGKNEEVLISQKNEL